MHRIVCLQEHERRAKVNYILLGFQIDLLLKFVSVPYVNAGECT